MACNDDPEDDCPPGQYRCRSCGGKRVCKPCPTIAEQRAVVDDRWAWCSKGPTPLCVPVAVFPTKQAADAWFVTQGHDRCRLVVVTDPDAVTWGTP